MKSFFITIFCIINLGLVRAQDKAYITVYAPVLAPNDTLELYMQDERIGEAVLNPSKLITAHNNAGYFHFVISDLVKPNWIGVNISFQKSSATPMPYLMHDFLMEAGDSVSIHLSPRMGKYRSLQEGYDGDIPIIMEGWDAEFSGRGAAKYQVLWDKKRLCETQSKEAILGSLEKNNPLNILYMWNIINQKAMAKLDETRAELSPLAYMLLKAQIKGEFGLKSGRSIDGLLYAAKDKNWKAQVKEELNKFITSREAEVVRFSDDYADAPKYVDYLAQYTWVALLNTTQSRDVELWYSFTKDLLRDSKVRDRVLATLLKERFQFKSSHKLLNDALSIVRDSLAYSHISLLRNALKGEKAFAFSLPDVEGKYHKMEDFKGKVVFMDFWFASCTPCRQYMLNVVGPVKKHFKNNPDVVFITVSIDKKEVFSKMLKQAEFLPEGGVHLYTDNQYTSHPIITHYQIMSYPYPLLVGKDGRLINEKATLSSQEELISAIEAGLRK
ncbi:TlpA family protein disulfide reductase [Sphingobacterium faecale]|uniref:TlpA family protein disulfide reductase n=1 Tax=Sphingobacterium faecale TaxID=2803775 RepID=A0ABS1R830_9SPHI|nr:TlpA disulfide reductase family protein [Sphingobacterium faecale]MBL1410379.1 TlpA family protein disulfide reductase [Sphingobacterium faecale]